MAKIKKGEKRTFVGVAKEYNHTDDCACVCSESMNKEGLSELLTKIVKKLDEIKEQDEEDLKKIDNDEFVYIKHEDKSEELHIENPSSGVWVISGEYVEYWANRIPLTSQENLHRIYKKFKNKGVIDKLKKAGMKEEDTISVEGTMFTITYYGE